MDTPNAVGSVGRFCGIKAIDPGSAPRNMSLKTRMGKNEFAATTNCNIVGVPLAELIPFKWLRSRSMMTLPFCTIIF